MAGSVCRKRRFLQLPLFIGAPKPLSFDLILENTVLFDEMIDDCLLLAVEPAGEAGYQEMERLYGVCHCTNRLSTILIDNNIIQFVRIFAPYGLWTVTRPLKSAVTESRNLLR